jgi:hypothetical protein
MRELEIRLIGDESVMRMLDELPGATQAQVIRPAMRDAMRTIGNALRSEAPEETGLLKRALGATPVKTYRNVLFATAGVRRGFRQAVTHNAKGRVRLTRKTPDQEGMYRNPTKYLHLVEGGRKALSVATAKALYSAQSGKFFGKRVQAAKPQPFVGRTFDRIADAVVVDVSETVAQGVVDAAARLGSRRT